MKTVIYAWLQHTKWPRNVQQLTSPNRQVKILQAWGANIDEKASYHPSKISCGIQCESYCKHRQLSVHIRQHKAIHYVLARRDIPTKDTSFTCRYNYLL